MKTPFNKWSPPKVARLWPEGSQVVWRIKLFELSYEKRFRYDISGWFRPDKIGVEYPWQSRDQVEFMLLECPILAPPRKQSKIKLARKARM